MVKEIFEISLILTNEPKANYGRIVDVIEED
jgi:hypothetical protein